MPRTEIPRPAQIAAHRGSRVLTTVAHVHPWGQQEPQEQQEIVLRVARGRKVRLARRAQGQLREAMGEVTVGPSALGRQMVARGQAHARRAMADAVSVPGGRTVAMGGAMGAGTSTGIGPDADVAAGTNQRCRK